MANQFTVTFEIQPSFYTKTGHDTINTLLNETLTETSEELIEYVKKECPVKTGTLRDGHYVQAGNNWVNIKNDVYYWKYVVYRGNDYINRGLLQFINRKILEEKVKEKCDEINKS